MMGMQFAAQIAATEWARANVGFYAGTPEDFGATVARVYAAALKVESIGATPPSTSAEAKQINGLDAEKAESSTSVAPAPAESIADAFVKSAGFSANPLQPAGEGESANPADFGQEGHHGEKPWYPDDRNWVEVPASEMGIPIRASEHCVVLFAIERARRMPISSRAYYRADGYLWGDELESPMRIVAYTIEAPK